MRIGKWESPRLQTENLFVFRKGGSTAEVTVALSRQVGEH